MNINIILFIIICTGITSTTDVTEVKIKNYQVIPRHNCLQKEETLFKI
jgi:hypothetical protein